MIKQSVSILVAVVAACGTPMDDNKKGKAVSAELKSSQLAALGSGLRLADSVSLTNVTGLADSLGLNFTENLACGFHLWGANSQSGRSGLEGRSYEEFDLGDPVSWTSMGEGLQGECETATVAQVESYFVYLDLQLSVGGTAKVVRAYMAQQTPFEAGDIVLKSGTTLSWYDKDAAALVDSSATRPSKPAQFSLAKEIPWYDNNGQDKIIMMEFRINVDSASYQVTKETGHVVVDVDFANSGVAITDTSDDAAILKTISLPFLDTQRYGSLLKAGLTLSEDRPPREDTEGGEGS